MSDKQPINSSKKSNKIKDFISAQGTKIAIFKSKISDKLKVYFDKIIHKEVYVDGQEPPKFYSFERRFYGLYVIFAISSLVLILAINYPPNNLVNTIIFTVSNAIVLFFLILSGLLSIDKLRVFLFEEKTFIKQIIFYLGLFALVLPISSYFSTSINFITYLLILAMIWLFLLSSRFYIYSRKFSTKIEARFIKKYSIPRYLLAIIIPFLILGILVIISLFYRSFLVILSLEIFSNFDPSSAVDVYILEMRVVMPLIYFSLVLTLVFIIFEFIFTRRRAETKRAGTFDNFTFSLIVLFIFFFQILQISIFMLLRPETIDAFKATVGATGSPVGYILLFEFTISMYFLYRVIKKTGGTLGWRILIFKKDGLILFFLACVLSQTMTRFALANEITNQEVTKIGLWLMADKYIISVLMIFLLGCTLLIYYIKPHETSMFMRLQKEIVYEEEKNIEKIYKIIRSEYIRRGEAFPIEILERELIKATQLSKSNVYSLIEHLVNKDMDILITERKEEFGKPIKLIDFTSVTERFDRKGKAQEKAKKYLAKRLYETSLAKKSRKSRLKVDVESEKASDQLIASLTTNYSKKQIDEQKVEEIKKEAQVTEELKIKLTPELKNQIIEILKNEYFYRIENREQFPDFFIPISEISDQIELNTKINPGELYPLLESLSNTDVELSLVDNPDEPEDKKIKFLPFADDNMNFSLANFRPQDYNEFRIITTRNFHKALKTKKEKRTLFQLKKEISDDTETQRSWSNLLNNLYKYYPLYAEKIIAVPNTTKLRNQLRKMEEAYQKIRGLNK
ncbi:MAG: hypothetical protein ACFFA6_01110 [Promethearchaeota archaeon]